MSARSFSLNADQLAALQVLKSQENVFLTGAAGSGKSFLLTHYLGAIRKALDEGGGKRVPILASTGAAAILVGGRTFHSFFGLGIMEGGISQTVERASADKRVRKRLNNNECVIIDEVSMLSGSTLRAAEAIARKTRESSSPWGGLRVIAVGDFAQLPPVNPFSQAKEWAFLDEVWAQSDFRAAVLHEPMRAKDPEFIAVLNDVRIGRVTERVRSFLSSREGVIFAGDFTSLFPRREAVERHNLEKLAEIRHPLHAFPTTYSGKEKDIEAFRRNSPLSEVIQLKKGALVMLRQNDAEGRWVNGTTGIIRDISDESLSVELLSGRNEGETFAISKAEFTLLNADGAAVVTARNFPVSLAWAMTVHKAQGTTLDRMRVDLRHIWEPGQAYVALSRAKRPDGLLIEGWSPSAIFADPAVARFHGSLVPRPRG